MIDQNHKITGANEGGSASACDMDAVARLCRGNPRPARPAADHRVQFLAHVSSHVEWTPAWIGTKILANCVGIEALKDPDRIRTVVAKWPTSACSSQLRRPKAVCLCDFVTRSWAGSIQRRDDLSRGIASSPLAGNLPGTLDPATRVLLRTIAALKGQLQQLRGRTHAPSLLDLDLLAVEDDRHGEYEMAACGHGRGTTPSSCSLARIWPAGRRFMTSTRKG
jgi:hypothetical protein